MQKWVQQYEISQNCNGIINEVLSARMEFLKLAYWCVNTKKISSGCFYEPFEVNIWIFFFFFHFACGEKVAVVFSWLFWDVNRQKIRRFEEIFGRFKFFLTISLKNSGNSRAAPPRHTGSMDNLVRDGLFQSLWTRLKLNSIRFTF